VRARSHEKVGCTYPRRLQPASSQLIGRERQREDVRQRNRETLARSTGRASPDRSDVRHLLRDSADLVRRLANEYLRDLRTRVEVVVDDLWTLA
jgi:hypothetical protein